MCRIDLVGHCISYGIVYNSYATLSRSIPWSLLILLFFTSQSSLVIKAQNEKCLKRSRNLLRRKEKGQETESESLVPTEKVICDHPKVAYVTIFYSRGGKVASL